MMLGFYCEKKCNISECKDPAVLCSIHTQMYVLHLLTSIMYLFIRGMMESV